MGDNILNTSHTYDDVENGTISHKQFIICEALDIIARDKKFDRDKICQWLLYHYGGTIEIAIIDHFRNQYC